MKHKHKWMPVTCGRFLIEPAHDNKLARWQNWAKFVCLCGAWKEVHMNDKSENMKRNPNKKHIWKW